MTVRRTLLALTVAGLLVVAGCGGGGTQSGTSVGGEPISFEQLAASGSTSAAAPSGRFAFDMSLVFPGADEPFAFAGEGAFDRAANRASFAVDLSSFAKVLGSLFTGLGGTSAAGAPDFDDPDGWQIELVQDGDVGYVRFPALDEQLPEGKSWIRAEKGERAGGLEFEQFDQFAQNDPRDVLETLRGVSSDVEVVGTETLRGVEVTHYRAVIEPKELAAQAATGKDQSLVDQVVSQSSVDEIPVDVWIDADGLVRKLSLAFSATEPGASQSGEVAMAFELWDYGEPVEIEVPPASEVVDASAVRG
jgi:hypothetical protein